MDRAKWGVAVVAILAGAGVAITAILAAGRGETKAVAENLPEQRGIAVTGHGEVFIKPDTAFVNVGVSVLAPSVAEARNKAAEEMDAVVASVKGNGVKDEDIQTTSFSIEPQYDYSANKPQLQGYRVSNTVSVRIRDLNSVGKIIDDGARAGGDDVVINGIRFTIDNNKSAIEQARKQAMDDAHDKADQLSRLGSVTLGDPITISESGGALPPPIYYDAARYAAAPAEKSTVVEPGQLSVSVDVAVTYSIK